MNIVRILPFLVILAACDRHLPSEHTISRSPVVSTRLLDAPRMIVGDFDGDGRPDTLHEHYVSMLDGKEIARNFEADHYDSLVESMVGQSPRCFITAGHSRIDTFFFNDVGDNQILGLSLLRNEGDLNGDGRDDISYVVNWADYSSVNSCNVITWRKNRWEELLHFMVRDWDLPPGGFIRRDRNGRISVRTYADGDTTMYVNGDTIMYAASDTMTRSYRLR